MVPLSTQMGRSCTKPGFLLFWLIEFLAPFGYKGATTLKIELTIRLTMGQAMNPCYTLQRQNQCSKNNPIGLSLGKQ
ncbi:unnamed protein product [Allacma fusca]|uniref:Uncharacterized protein n=1 Tax=Allacma fusca TaxID=39272 RepID=A0A8J2PQR8_9HEXA|nr:unnamed protein product [Allacma fusca]